MWAYCCERPALIKYLLCNHALVKYFLFSLVVVLFHSDYQWDYMWGNATSADLHQSAPLGPGVIDALWQLSLALIFRIVIFVFTVGIKVSA